MHTVIPEAQFPTVAALINQRLLYFALRRDFQLTRAPACLGQAAGTSLKHEWLPAVELNQIN
jgi:hypothetical protein